jgi:hypothetical protein
MRVAPLTEQEIAMINVMFYVMVFQQSFRVMLTGSVNRLRQSLGEWLLQIV